MDDVEFPTKPYYSITSKHIFYFVTIYLMYFFESIYKSGSFYLQIARNNFRTIARRVWRENKQYEMKTFVKCQTFKLISLYAGITKTDIQDGAGLT